VHPKLFEPIMKHSWIPITFHLVYGCYSPNVPTQDSQSETGSEVGGTSVSGASDASTSEASTSSTSPDGTDGSQETNATTSDPSSTTTMDETGEPSSSTTAGASADSTTETPADPYCGDGSVDAGEECDLGAENAASAECRPDCTSAECGDGDVWEGVEACDDGPDGNVLALGSCAPDCSKVIEEKFIVLSDTIATGDLGANPVATADGNCPIGYLAMFAFPGVREAAVDPYDDSESVDWVLQPYTAYARQDGTPIWITDETALLGVRDQQPDPLENGIIQVCPDGFVCLEGRVITGITSSWVTSTTDNDTCDDWTDGTESGTVRRGQAESTTTFLYDASFTTDCEFTIFGGGTTGFYCVEQ
jgi:hypothetical protein